MPKVKNPNALVGNFINFVYSLSNGNTVKFSDDSVTYLGNQLECEFGGDRCLGIIGNMDFLLVCTYEEKGANPELVIYKKGRQVLSFEPVNSRFYFYCVNGNYDHFKDLTGFFYRFDAKDHFARIYNSKINVGLSMMCYKIP